MNPDTTRDYLPDDHVPYADLMKKLYHDASKELLKPFPSLALQRFPNLTKLIGGLRAHEFTILCGSTGTGKTTLCANLSLDLIEQNVPHFVASVETGHTDFVKRVISAKVGKDWNTGDPVPVALLKEFHAKYGGIFSNSTAWLSLYDNRFAVQTLMADLASMVKNHGCQVAFIDNLNFFLDVTSARESVAEMDRVMHELIIFVKRVPIHIVMVMHPKKTDTGRVESEFDIKGSSTAVQEAHNVLLFNRPHPDLVNCAHPVASENDREILIAKVRRKGKYVRRRLIIKASEGVSYTEGVIV